MLKAALQSYPHTRPLLDGSLRVQGCDLDLASLDQRGIFPAFRAMARTLAYDVSELGISTALCAVEQGVPIRVLPVFVTRRFDHGGIFVQASSTISGPADLKGARVGVRSFTVTDAVWSAATLFEALDCTADDLTWVVTDEEHIEDQPLPASASRMAGRTPMDLLSAGEVDVIFDPVTPPGPGVRPLFGDIRAAERAWFQEHGYIPPHHTVVVRESALQENPGLGERLFDAFVQAKAGFLERFASGSDVLAEDESPTGPRHDYGVERVEDLVGPDPMPYGISANRKALEDFVEYMKRMRLVSRSKMVDDLFLPFG